MTGQKLQEQHRAADNNIVHEKLVLSIDVQGTRHPSQQLTKANAKKMQDEADNNEAPSPVTDKNESISPTIEEMADQEQDDSMQEESIYLEESAPHLKPEDLEDLANIFDRIRVLYKKRSDTV